MKRIFMFSALAAVLLTFICMLGGCSSKTTVINLKDYVSVSYDGYNGSGKAIPTINLSALIALLKDKYPEDDMIIANSFRAADIANNGMLSNGEIISVTVTFDEMLMKNSDIFVMNPVLQFPVSGLKEKEKLDVFANVDFETSGISPECAVSTKYKGAENIEFVFKTASGEEVSQSEISELQFKNGEKITVKISDKSLDNLRKKYIIDEVSRDYTVQVEGKYVLSNSDLSESDRKEIDGIAQDYIDEIVNAFLNGGERDARIKLISTVSNVNKGTLYASSNRIDELKNLKFNSAYIGIGNLASEWGSTKNVKCAYYFYEAEIAYYINTIPAVQGESPCVLVVRIDEPVITSAGLSYSNIDIECDKDFTSAYNARITSEFEKLN